MSSDDNKVYTGNSAAFVDAEYDVRLSAAGISELKTQLALLLKEHTKKVLHMKTTMGGATRFLMDGKEYCIAVRPTDDGETAFIREFTPRGKSDPAKKAAKAAAKAAKPDATESAPVLDTNDEITTLDGFGK